jgi:hypothetical protein
MRRTLLLSITGKRNPANVHIACLSGQNRISFPELFSGSFGRHCRCRRHLPATPLNASSARRDQVLCKTLSFHCNF